jgi:hypothetical protein
MDAWAHQPGFPLITLRIAGQNGEAADDDSDDDDDQGASSSAPLRLTAQQVRGVRSLRTPAACSADVLSMCWWQWRELAHAPLVQETFASGQQLACGGTSDGSTRRPWWVPLSHIAGDASGNEVSPANWVVLDACSTGACIPTHDLHRI